MLMLILRGHHRTLLKIDCVVAVAVLLLTWCCMCGGTLLDGEGDVMVLFLTPYKRLHVSLDHSGLPRDIDT